MSASSVKHPAYAGLFVRLVAWLIDHMLLAVGTTLLIRLPALIAKIVSGNWRLGERVLFHYSITAILVYLAGVLYYTLLTYYTGQTLGKALMKIRVFFPDPADHTFLNVLFRETVGKYLSGLLMIGYLVVAVDEQKRGFHDMLCDSRVIYRDVERVVPAPDFAEPMPEGVPQQVKYSQAGESGSPVTIAPPLPLEEEDLPTEDTPSEDDSAKDGTDFLTENSGNEKENGSD